MFVEQSGNAVINEKNKISKPKKGFLNIEAQFRTLLMEFVQNEHNSSLYYNALSKKSDDLDIKNILKEISMECCRNEQSYCHMLKNILNESFLAENRIIQTQVSLKDGIKKAIAVETEELLKEKRLYSKLSKDIKDCFNDTIYSRMERLNNLQFIFCSIS